MFVYLVDSVVKGYHENFEDVERIVREDFNDDPARESFVVFEVSKIYELIPKLEEVSEDEYFGCEEGDCETEEEDLEEKGFKIIEKNPTDASTINF